MLILKTQLSSIALLPLSIGTACFKTVTVLTGYTFYAIKKHMPIAFCGEGKEWYFFTLNYFATLPSSQSLQ
jgi:hypothetical protein